MPCKIKKTNCILSTYCGTTVVLPFQGRKWGVVRKYWTKGKAKPSMANSKSCSSMSHARGGDAPPRVADYSTLLFLGLFHLLCAALFGWYPTALVPPTFWGLQYNPVLTLTASHNGGYYGSPFRDSSCHMSVLSSFP